MKFSSFSFPVVVIVHFSFFSCLFLLVLIIEGFLRRKTKTRNNMYTFLHWFALVQTTYTHIFVDFFSLLWRFHLSSTFLLLLLFSSSICLYCIPVCISTSLIHGLNLFVLFCLKTNKKTKKNAAEQCQSILYSTDIFHI